MPYHILFDGNEPISSREISGHVHGFGEAYTETVRTVIRETNDLHLDERIFIKNSATLLSSFGMARSGVFKGIGISRNGKVRGPSSKLLACWNEAKEELLSLRKYLNDKNLKPRSRTLILLDANSRMKVIGDVWKAFKKLLPMTMTKYSFGLVGASKILFSVLPEITLPVDNSEWLNVFKTVDIGDVIDSMANEIMEWEKVTGEQLQNCDHSEFTTLPAVYNVMAMEARP